MKCIPWWRHQIETFSALLALSLGNSLVTDEFPLQMPVTRSFDVFFDLRLNKRLNKQSWGWWFETPSHSLWLYCNACSWLCAAFSNTFQTHHSKEFGQKFQNDWMSPFFKQRYYLPRWKVTWKNSAAETTWLLWLFLMGSIIYLLYILVCLKIFDRNPHLILKPWAIYCISDEFLCWKWNDHTMGCDIRKISVNSSSPHY